MGEIPEGWMALDIGPENFMQTVKDAKTVVWTVLMARFDVNRSGTEAVAKAMSETDAVTIYRPGW